MAPEAPRTMTPRRVLTVLWAIRETATRAYWFADPALTDDVWTADPLEAKAFSTFDRAETFRDKIHKESFPGGAENYEVKQLPSPTLPTSQHRAAA